MYRHSVLGILICGCSLSMVCTQASAQEPPWNEGPGDIVITRQVPRQNAVLVGEPGRPTLVNPRTSIGGANAFSLGASSITQPLSDLEAEAVRATRTPEVDALDDPTRALKSEGVGEASFAGSQSLGHDRTGFVGTAVSGAMGGATRQIQGVLSSALGRGRL